MTVSRAFAPLVALALLLSMTAGLGLHDHGATVERGSYECAIDHEREHEAGSRGPASGLRARGKQHEHQCIGCHLSSQRYLLGELRTAVAGLDADRDSRPNVAPAPRASAYWTGRTLRGPPSA